VQHRTESFSGPTLLVTESAKLASQVRKVWHKKDGALLTLSLPMSASAGDFSLTSFAETELRQVTTAIREAHPHLQGLLWIHPKSPQHPDELLQTALLLSGQLGLGQQPVAQAYFVTFATEESGFHLSGALAGLARTLQAEWPHALCRHLELPPHFQNEDLPAVLWEEWTDADRRLQFVVRETDQRSTLQQQFVRADDWNAGEASRDLVWLVSGGAQGVTAHCVLELAEQAGGTFLLLGRSRLEEEPAWAKGLPNEQLQAAALAILTSMGKKPTPPQLRQIVSEVRASRAIRQTLHALREKGAAAEYLSVDVHHTTELQAQLAPHLERYGPVRGLIHGAGVLADQLIEKKTAQDFQRVYGTKVGGLRSLLAVVEADQLQQVLLFSSAAGFFGNVGQSDYALANEALNRFAWQWSLQHPQARVLSFNWGPWDGGMVTPQLRQMFAERGVQVIPPQEGAHIFAKAALHNAEHPSPVLVIGNSMSKPRWPQEPEVRVVRAPLTANQHLLFQEHALAGVPVLPATFALAWMLDLAEQSYPSLRVQEFRNLRVLQGIRFDESLRDEYEIELQTEPYARGVGVTLQIRSAATKKKRAQPHYQVHVTLEPKAPIALDEPTREPLPPLLERSPAYEDGALFHTGLFQMLRVLPHAAPHEFAATVPEIPAAQAQGFVGNRFAPMVLDAGFQAMLVWARQATGLPSLPLACESGRFVDGFPTSGDFRIVFEETLRNEHKLVGRLRFYDTTGTLIGRLAGAEVTLSESLRSKFPQPRP
jgi:NAD(P)-dependent dehydrogenase (short-subunit alcohol dehydrogenase family)